MGRIEIAVKKDTCLGYTVYRGSVRAKELTPATWIDFYDQVNNPYGYQRPFNAQRSKSAAGYAETEERAFWPECILSIRDLSDVEDPADKVLWSYNPLSTGNADFGTLFVEYNENRTESIAGESVKWRRAFSEVDCQHRLGHMANSDKLVTVCIIPDLTRLSEALIFKTINDTQKKISTSLVDAIVILLSTNKLDDPALHWAYNLGIDYGSPFYNLVDAEGRNLSRLHYIVTLRTLKTCLSSLVGGRRYIRNITNLNEYEEAYIFLRNYWSTISGLWPNQFKDTTNYKLMTVPGLKGLARFGRNIFTAAMTDGNTDVTRIRTFFNINPNLFDWSSGGPLRQATGNAGQKIVFDELIKHFGAPQ